MPLKEQGISHQRAPPAKQRRATRPTTNSAPSAGGAVGGGGATTEEAGGEETASLAAPSLTAAAAGVGTHSRPIYSLSRKVAFFVILIGFLSAIVTSISSSVFSPSNIGGGEPPPLLTATVIFSNIERRIPDPLLPLSDHHQHNKNQNTKNKNKNTFTRHSQKEEGEEKGGKAADGGDARQQRPTSSSSATSREEKENEKRRAMPTSQNVRRGRRALADYFLHSHDFHPTHTTTVITTTTSTANITLETVLLACLKALEGADEGEKRHQHHHHQHQQERRAADEGAEVVAADATVSDHHLCRDFRERYVAVMIRAMAASASKSADDGAVGDGSGGGKERSESLTKTSLAKEAGAIVETIRAKAKANGEAFFISQGGVAGDYHNHHHDSTAAAKAKKRKGKQQRQSGQRRFLLWPHADGEDETVAKADDGSSSSSSSPSDRYCSFSSSSRVYATPTRPHPSCVAEYLIRTVLLSAPEHRYRGSSSSSSYTVYNDAPMSIDEDVDVFHKYIRPEYQCYKHGGHEPGVPRTGPRLSLSSASSSSASSSSASSSSSSNLAINSPPPFDHRFLTLEDVVYYKGELFLMSSGTPPSSTSSTSSASTSSSFGSGKATMKRLESAVDAILFSGRRGENSNENHHNNNRESNNNKKHADASSSPSLPITFNYAPSFSMIKGNWPQPIFGNISLTVLDGVQSKALMELLTGAISTSPSSSSPTAGGSEDGGGRRDYSLSSDTPFSSSSVLNVPTAYWQPPTDFNSHYHTFVELTMPAFHRRLAEEEEKEEEIAEEDEERGTAGEGEGSMIGLAESSKGSVEVLNPLIFIPPSQWDQLRLRGPSSFSSPAHTSFSSSTTASLLRSIHYPQPQSLLLPPSLMLTSRPRRAGFTRNFAPLGGGGGGGGSGGGLNTAKTCRYAPPLTSSPSSVAPSSPFPSPPTPLWDESDEAFAAVVTSPSPLLVATMNGTTSSTALSPPSSQSIASCLSTMLAKMTVAAVGSLGVYGIEAGHSQFAHGVNVGAGMAAMRGGGAKRGLRETRGDVEAPEWHYKEHFPSSSSSSSSSSSPSPSSPPPSSSLLFFIRRLLVGNPTHCEPLWGPDPFYAEALAQEQFLRGTRYTRRLFQGRGGGGGGGRRRAAAAAADDGEHAVNVGGGGEEKKVARSSREKVDVSPFARTITLTAAQEAILADSFWPSYLDCQSFLWAFRNFYLQSVLPIVPMMGSSRAGGHKAYATARSSVLSRGNNNFNSADVRTATALRSLLVATPLPPNKEKSLADRHNLFTPNNPDEARNIGDDVETFPSSSETQNDFLLVRRLLAGGGGSQGERRKQKKDKGAANAIIPPILHHPIQYIPSRHHHRSQEGDAIDPISIVFTSRRGDWARYIVNEDEVVSTLKSHLRRVGELLGRLARREGNGGGMESGWGAGEEGGELDAVYASYYFAKLSKAQKLLLSEQILKAKLSVKKFTDKKMLEHQLLHESQLDANHTTVFIGNHGANYIPSLFLRPNAAVITMSFATPGFYPFSVLPNWIHFRDLRIEQECNRRLYRGKCKWSSGNNNDNVVSKPHQMGRLLELVVDVIVEQVLAPRG